VCSIFIISSVIRNRSAIVVLAFTTRILAMGFWTSKDELVSIWLEFNYFFKKRSTPLLQSSVIRVIAFN
jgi:hypothetical protein